VPENLLTLLNYLLLALLYLFFARVLWAVWSEVRASRSRAAPTVPPGPPPATIVTRPASAPRVAKPSKTTKVDRKARKLGGPATQLVVVQPPERVGATYPLGLEMTIGRAAGCHVQVSSDSFASSLHARVYVSDGLTMVEDLGSTNGTFVNGARVGGPTAIKPGDRVQVGGTVLEVR
jgi:FHA domain-containing protein